MLVRIIKFELKMIKFFTSFNELFVLLTQINLLLLRELKKFLFLLLNFF